MGRISTAFKAFFACLGNAETAGRVQEALSPPALPKDNRVSNRDETVAKSSTPSPSVPKRSEAVTLLSALQREARLVDLVQEPLEQYSDEQIGSAARKVLQDSKSVLERFFALACVRSEAEGAAVEIPAANDPAVVRLTGAVSGEGPFRGRLTHPGWKATQVQLPAWTGGKDAALVVAPAEVEVGG